jgi:BTB/POZ domain
MTTPKEVDSFSARKLRSVSAPDLKIIVGNGGDQQSHYYHSLLLAFHSDYVDAMLASPWTESKSRELTFPDIHPAVWKKMLELLQDPMKGRKMTIEDALQVFPFYDKYQFPKGIQLCDQLFYEYTVSLEPTSTDHMNTLIEVALLADRVIDGCAKEICVNHLLVTLSKLMYTEEQIQKLAPLVSKERALLEAIGVTKQEFLSPLFGQYWHTRQLIREVGPLIDLRLKLGGVKSAEFTCTGFRSYRSKDWPSGFIIGYIQYSSICVELMNETSEWTICGTFYRFGERESRKTVLWVNQNRGTWDVPPRTGWEAADESVNGIEATIVYEKS